MNKSLINYMDRTFYRKFESKWDDKLLRSKILEYLKPGYVILDVGAGRGRVQEMSFKGLARQVFGIDPDPRVVENPLLDKGFQGLADHMPFFADNTFDLVFCDNVLEHVERPGLFYSEIARVLKPGGYFISKTPNRFYYVAIIAALTPHAFHSFVNKKRGRSESDTFPTFYRANTASAQRKWAKQSGLRIVEIDYIEGRPEYLRIYFFTYLMGLIYERIVNFLGLKFLKAVILTVSQKN
jgi:SAM-dependent methyltransferase